MVTPTQPGHRFLHIAKYHLNERDAERYVMRLLRRLDPTVRAHNWKTSGATVTRGDRTTSHTFRELVRLSRELGTAQPVREVLDARDRFFGGMFGMATGSEGISITMECAGHRDSLKGPARCHPIENELTEDILFLRQRACEASGDAPFDETARCYRAYVLACTSLIEAFLNRHVHLADHGGDPTATRDALASSNLESRLDQWLQRYAQSALIAVKDNSVEWDHFQKLRKARNLLIHGATPYLGFSVKRLATDFNLVRAGVGRFLAKIRKLQGAEPLGFMERLGSAPVVTYRSSKRKKK